MLESLIHVSDTPDPSAEDIFSSALSLISPDDTSTLYGDPGSFVTYRSKRFGDVVLKLSQPDTEEERRLFAQYLWNAGVLLAEFLSLSVVHHTIGRSGDAAHSTSGGTPNGWNVAGEKVLELGAGEYTSGCVIPVT
jgi:hypothetical protein